MNKFMMMVVLLVGYLWTDAANAQVYWEKYQETDEMTGKTSEPIALIAVNWGNVFFPEIHLSCYTEGSNTSIRIIMITLGDTMPHIEWFSNQWGNGYKTPIRIAWGNGGVDQLGLVQREYANKFATDVYFDATRMEPANFKLELIGDDGDKYYIGSGGVDSDGTALSGNSYLVEHLTACKNSAVKYREKKIAEEKAAQELKAEQDSELSKYVFSVRQHILHNYTRPAKIAPGSHCLIKTHQYSQLHDDSNDHRLYLGGDTVRCVPEKYRSELMRVLETAPVPTSNFGDGQFYLVIRFEELFAY